MRNLILVGFCLLTALIATSQDKCGTKDQEVPESLKEFDQSAQFNETWKQSQAVELVPTVIHVVRNSNGSGGLGIEDLEKGISGLVVPFEDLEVQFIVVEINYIDDDVFSTLDLQIDEDDDLVAAHPPVADKVNIYVIPRIGSDTGGSLNGFAYYPWASTDYIMMRLKAFDNESTLAHELGHYYGLYHTHRLTVPEEYVNGSNCATHGDLVCDTPADPDDLDETVLTNCVYTGGATDSNGDTYAPDPSLFMSSAEHECRFVFSMGQYNRMGSYKVSHRNYFSHAGPVGKLTSPSIGQHLPSTGTISLQADALDMDGGTVTNVEFWVDGVSVGSDSTEPFTLNHSISQPGIYTSYVVTTDDSGNTHTSYEVEFAVGTDLFSQQINASYDDAEETIIDGDMSRTSSDLEIGYDDSDQIVGLKFNNVNVPKNATIVDARIQFTVDEYSRPESYFCDIYGEDNDQPGSYGSSDFSISSRNHTTATVQWLAEGWGYEDWYPVADAHSSQRTANLKTIVEEIMARPGWLQGNNMAFMLYGSGGGLRVAESFNGSASSAPELIIHYTIEGCTDSAACNYDPAATSDDGSCDYSCFGCTDTAACNYDSVATVDDGSCDYSCFGCTDSGACNFDPAATVEDGSCDYSCLGCTDSSACNFDSLATIDDGSCDYTTCVCVGDFNGDLQVNVEDLLMFIADFGCLGAACIGDLDQNGTTDSSDLLLFLPTFGNVCP